MAETLVGVVGGIHERQLTSPSPFVVLGVAQLVHEAEVFVGV